MNKLSIGTVVFESVSKRYRLGGLGTLRGTMAALSPRRRDGDQPRDLWALRDVSFRVEPGESLGLIGPNGAGKTTSLKLLSNITRPTSGRIQVSGRVSSLIELGAGFHPELTGRDNIFLNGAILGLKRQEIQQRLDAIIAFSELERFIDTPVKRYSSGMYVRLGFAVAAHVEPDILLVDEVLAVGDASFRHRCTQRMKELQNNGTTLLFVSHNMHLVRNVCNRAALIVDGRLQAEGEPNGVIAQYERSIVARQSYAGADAKSATTSDGDGDLLIRSVRIASRNQPSNAVLASSAPATFVVRYRAVTPVNLGRVLLMLLREDGTVCCAIESGSHDHSLLDLTDVYGEGTWSITCAPLQLTAGIYFPEVMVTDSSDNIVLASAQGPRFQVDANGSGQSRGVFVPNVTWTATSGDDLQQEAEAGL